MNTRRRSLLRAGAGALVLPGLGALGDGSRRVVTVGYLANQIPLEHMRQGAASPDRQIAEFVEGMRRLGWEEGSNVRYAWRSAEGQFDRHPALAAELVRMKVDVLVAFGVGAEAAARLTKSVPIVVANTYWLVEKGLARSLSKPGGNVTGLTVPDAGEMVPKRLELTKLVQPGASRIALVTVARGEAADGYPRYAEIMQRPQFARPARALGLEFLLMTFGDAATLPEVMRSAARQGVHSIHFDDNAPFHFRDTQVMIAAEARRLRMPVMMSILSAPENGVLMAYGIDHAAGTRRMPYYVDRILRGDKPGDIPIETPAKVELHINMQAARAIGLEIPKSVLLQADRVIG